MNATINPAAKLHLDPTFGGYRTEDERFVLSPERWGWVLTDGETGKNYWPTHGNGITLRKSAENIIEEILSGAKTQDES